MSAPKGNKNAVGNSGGKKGRSGRKSVYQKEARYDLLKEMWFRKYSKEEINELRKTIASGRYSMLDSWMLSGLCGDERVLLAVFNKLFPKNMNPIDNTELNMQIVYVRKNREDLPETKHKYIDLNPIVSKEKQH